MIRELANGFLIKILNSVVISKLSTNHHGGPHEIQGTRNKPLGPVAPFRQGKGKMPRASRAFFPVWTSSNYRRSSRSERGNSRRICFDPDPDEKIPRSPFWSCFFWATGMVLVL